MLNRRVVGCVNVTWIRRVMSQAKIVREFLDDVKAAAAKLAAQVESRRAS